MSAQSCFPDANRGWQAHGGIGVTGISSGVSRDTPTKARHELRVAMVIGLCDECDSSMEDVAGRQSRYRY